MFAMWEIVEIVLFACFVVTMAWGAQAHINMRKEVSVQYFWYL